MVCGTSKGLAQAGELGKKYNLHALIENQSKASKSTAEYLASVERSEKVLVRKKKSDQALVDNAPIMMENVGKYVESVKQTKLMS